MGAAIQFKGVDSVMKAYDNKGIEAWSVWQSRYFQHKGIGADELRSYLEMMKPAGSECIYTLKVYEGIEDISKIKERTEADGSFNFKLSEEGYVSGSSEIFQLRERIKKLEEGDDDEDKSVLGKIGNSLLGLLEEPKELVAVIGAIKSLWNNTPASHPMAIAGVVRDFAPPYSPNGGVAPIDKNHFERSSLQTKKTSEMSDEEKNKRLRAAIDTLGKNDEQAIVHLEKLAKLSEEKPALFKSLLVTLDQF